MSTVMIYVLTSVRVELKVGKVSRVFAPDRVARCVVALPHSPAVGTWRKVIRIIQVMEKYHSQFPLSQSCIT